MHDKELIPHLFRTEYRKIISVLCRLFGIEHIETAEDIVSDTFLMAAETWGLKGIPQNPTAWLYTVAKNKAKDFLKRHTLFSQKISPELRQHGTNEPDEAEIDLSLQNIRDSQLQMMFAICHPCIPAEAQIGLALSILCGFGAEEIADAFLSSRDAVYKRLGRAKETLRAEKVRIAMPGEAEIGSRLDAVLTTLYLLFSEGYYSTSQSSTLRKELCLEAMRLNLTLTENPQTNTPAANALLSLMCFHASRFEARQGPGDELVLYEDQDTSLWSRELIDQGERYMNLASHGTHVSKYHLEAAIAWWHTHKEDTKEKWENILQLYNRLLLTSYSPVAALNRTYALSKANSVEEAIREAEKLELKEDHLYHALLASLYTGIDTGKSLLHLREALSLAKTSHDKAGIEKKIAAIEQPH